jgi:hypothetical protein
MFNEEEIRRKAIEINTEEWHNGNSAIVESYIKGYIDCKNELLDVVYKVLVEKYFFTEQEAKDVEKDIINYNNHD